MKANSTYQVFTSGEVYVFPETHEWYSVLHQLLLRAAGPRPPRFSDLNVGTRRNLDSFIVYWCGAVARWWEFGISVAFVVRFSFYGTITVEVSGMHVVQLRYLCTLIHSKSSVSRAVCRRFLLHS